MRPTVFGMMDGLVSNFALIAGVAGAHASQHVGRRWPGWPDWSAARSRWRPASTSRCRARTSRPRAELEVERHELRAQRRGRAGRAGRRSTSRAASTPSWPRRSRGSSRATPTRRCSIHAQEELGVDPSQLPSPWTAAGSSLLSFSVGALLPLLPYLFGATTLWISAVLAVVALFAAGALSSRFTVRSWLFAGARQLLLGVVAAAVTFGVGALFHVAVG